MPLMGAAPQQKSGFDLRNIINSPLFLMGAGVLGSPNIGQGLMTGAQAAERIRSGDLSRQLQERQLSMQQQAHNARMAQMNDPLARQQREAELALTRARTTNALRGPESSLKFGLNPIPYMKPDGTMGYMVPNTAGEARALEIPGGGTALPPASTVQTPTEVITKDKFGRVLRRESKDLAGAELQRAEGSNLAKLKMTMPKDRGRIRSLESGWRTVDENIQRAEAIVARNPNVLGLVGTAAARVPGTEAYDLAQVLNTIKSNIGFDKLQDMRDNSPTGGALGQVSEFENVLLQATQGSLVQGQSQQQFLFNLRNIKRNYDALKAGVYQAHRETYAPIMGGQQSVVQPMQGPSRNEANFAAPQLAPAGSGFSAKRLP